MDLEIGELYTVSDDTQCRWKFDRDKFREEDALRDYNAYGYWLSIWAYEVLGIIPGRDDEHDLPKSRVFGLLPLTFILTDIIEFELPSRTKHDLKMYRAISGSNTELKTIAQINTTIFRGKPARLAVFHDVQDNDDLVIVIKEGVIDNKLWNDYCIDDDYEIKFKKMTGQ